MNHCTNMEPSPEPKNDIKSTVDATVDSPLRITKLFKKLRIDPSDQNDLGLLPAEVINLIYFYMDRSSAFRASQICRFWYECSLNFFKTWLDVEKLEFRYCTFKQSIIHYPNLNYTSLIASIARQWSPPAYLLLALNFSLSQFCRIASS